MAEGVNPNFEVSSRIQPGKPICDSSQAGVKRSLDSGEDTRRRSSRLNKIRPINFNLTQFTLVESYQVDGEVKTYYIPKTYAQAIACDDSALWIAAMEKELKGLENAECFEVEVLPDGANPIPSKWVFTPWGMWSVTKLGWLLGGIVKLKESTSRKLSVQQSLGTLSDFS